MALSVANYIPWLTSCGLSLKCPVCGLCCSVKIVFKIVHDKSRNTGEILTGLAATQSFLCSPHGVFPPLRYHSGWITALKFMKPQRSLVSIINLLMDFSIAIKLLTFCNQKLLSHQYFLQKTAIPHLLKLCFVKLMAMIQSPKILLRIIFRVSVSKDQCLKGLIKHSHSPA